MGSQEWQASWWTRRALLGTAAGAALGAYGLSQGLAAEVPRTFDGAGFQLRAAEPQARRSGVLRYGFITAPAHFDVHQQGATIVQLCMYDNLVRRHPRDSGQTIIPDLAHSWEVANDSKTYTFWDRLREPILRFTLCAARPMPSNNAKRLLSCCFAVTEHL